MLEILLLGPVEVWAGTVRVPLAPLERDLLALLALQPGTVSSTDRIIDGLWGERPPAAPRSRVQGLVSGLRRKVGATLVTRQPGYLLDLPAEATDIGRCEALARRVRAAPAPTEKAELARRALELWRGEPLDGASAPGADPDRTRLAELRVGLMEQCFEAELALGQHAEVVGELAAAVSAYPLRERLVLQLMAALYKCNRQADAMRAYTALHERLAAELGAEPCVAARELRALILRGEPLPENADRAEQSERGERVAVPQIPEQRDLHDLHDTTRPPVVPRPRTALAEGAAADQPVSLTVSALTSGNGTPRPANGSITGGSGAPSGAARGAGPGEPDRSPSRADIADTTLTPPNPVPPRRARKPGPPDPAEAAAEDPVSNGPVPPGSGPADPISETDVPEPVEAPRLVRTSPAAPPPAQMPASSGHFLGRDSDLAALTAALPGPRDEPRVLVVSGAGGLGKTALVVRWAHAVADRFPDGQIFVGLRPPRSSGPPQAGTALGAVLLALGVSADRLPVSAEERAALYRTLIHGRRVLVVADDVQAVGQVLPLVPPTPGSLIVATSRSRLTALSIHHAVRTLTIEPLGPDSSLELLRAIVGPERLHGVGVSELVALCGGWPLALRIAGATLAARSQQSPASFTAELRERIDTLTVAGDPRTVRAALAAARAELAPAASRLFGQLGLLPGGSVCLQLAAAAAGVSVLRARRLLDELISANLVVETGPDRYRLYAMVLRYARHCGAELPDRDVVEERVARWYVQVFESCARQVAPAPEPANGRGPAWLRDPAQSPPPGPQPQPRGTESPAEWLPFADGDAALFLDFERPNLVPVARWFAERGEAELTWRFVRCAQAADPDLPVEAGRLGLAAAAELDDQRALGAAHAQLGVALLADPVQLAEADRHLTRAAELLENEAGRPQCAAAFGLGRLRARQRRPHEARAAMEHTLNCLDPGQEPLSYAIALVGYADVLAGSGRVRKGQERFAQALILGEAAVGGRFERSGGPPGEPEGRDFLSYLGRRLDGPRVTASDRALARTLIAISRALPPLRGPERSGAAELDPIGIAVPPVPITRNGAP